MSYIIRPRNWIPINKPELSFMDGFSSNIEQLERREPNLLPNIRRGSTILIASDYSGEHDLAEYQSLSFLFADIEHCGVWESKRQQIRQQYLSDGRRIAFKNLRDKRSLKALSPFLAAADEIPGLSLTLLVHKGIDSLFRKSGTIDMSDTELQEYSHWPKTSFEKMLRIVHVLGLFLSGLSRSSQNVMWITDEDEIAANEQRLRELTEITARIASHYLNHSLGHLRCGTTKCDNGTRQLEDLASIPDLVAGALSEVLVVQKSEGLSPQSSIIIGPPQNLSPKTVKIMNWFATNIQPLKRLVYVIEPVQGTTVLNLKRMKFHGSSDV